MTSVTLAGYGFWEPQAFSLALGGFGGEMGWAWRVTILFWGVWEMASLAFIICNGGCSGGGPEMLYVGLFMKD